MSWNDTLRRIFSERQRHEPNPLQRAALSALLIVVVAGGVVLLLAAGKWFDVSTPTWLMLCGSVPMALVATLMATSYEEQFSPQRLLAPALVSLGVTLSLGVALGMLWREDGMRARALEFASDHGISPVLTGAIQSNDHKFGVLACRKLIASSSGNDQTMAFQSLLKHPKYFASCMEGSPLRATWSARLVDGWMSSMNEAKDEATACAWSDTLGMASTSDVPGAAVALLSCTLSSEGVQNTCCHATMRTYELSGDRLAEIITRAAPHPVHEGAMSVALVDQAAMTHAVELGFGDSERLKRYGYLTACRNLTGDRLDIAGAMTNAVITRCQVREKSLRERVNFWESVCQDVTDKAIRRQDMPIEALFCMETRNRMVVRATKAAKSRVYEATLTSDTQDVYRMQKLAGIINRAAVSSGFIPSDSTGIVSEYEGSRYSRSASDQALHKIGERKLKRPGDSKNEKEARERTRQLNESLERSPQPKISPTQRKKNRDLRLDELMGSDP